MKRIVLILAVMLAVQRLPAQSGTEGPSAPLLLCTNGCGTISPYNNGQMLEVGHNYTLSACPASGFSFDGWRQVTMATTVQVTRYPSDAWEITTNTYVVRRGRIFVHSLYIIVPAVSVSVSSNGPSVTTVTRTEGWEADFKQRKAYPIIRW